MSTPLPDRWDDEPWPLDDPIPAPSLTPTNWSDTHDDPPQVADLADEAWEYALDHGVSMEVALVEAQQREVWHRHFAEAQEFADKFQEAMEKVVQVFVDDVVPRMKQFQQVTHQAVMQQVNGSVLPTRTLDLWSFTRDGDS